MAVPYTFATATGSIPLSQLDTNFATGITIGNTSVQLGSTITTINNTTLANVTITSVGQAFPNGYLANSNVIVGTTTLTLGSTVTTLEGVTLGNVTIASGNVTITNVSVTTANVSGTANISNLVVISNGSFGGNVTIGGNVTASLGGTLTNVAVANTTVTNYTESVVAIGNSSTSKTISLTSGTVQTVTLTGNCTFTMPTATAGKSFILILSTGAGSFTSTFTSVKFPNNVSPTITTTASRWDILTFVADGTYWFGNFAQAYA